MAENRGTEEVSREYLNYLYSDEAQRIAVQLAPLVEAMNGNGFQAVMAKASLKVRGVLDSTTMRLPNVGPGEAEIKRAEDGMRASGLL